MKHSPIAVLFLVVFSSLAGPEASAGPPPDAGRAKTTAAQDVRRAESLRRELASLRPRGHYILIDTAANRLSLVRDRQVMVDAVCSTGSGRTLVAGDRKWTFRTPRGEFRIIAKVSNPVWRKPDWAFLEQGEPVPREERLRYESGVLGEYALAIGDGYLIHGTLYSRLLGQNVTHGCIRLGSADLIEVSRTAPVGTRVLIY